MTEELVPINTVSHQLGEHPGMPVDMLRARHFPRFWRNYRITLAAAMRDGLHASQAVAILEDRDHEKMMEADARRRLDELIAAYREKGNGLWEDSAPLPIESRGLATGSGKPRHKRASRSPKSSLL